MNKIIKNISALLLGCTVALLPLSCKEDEPTGPFSYSVDGVDSQNGECINIEVSQDGYGFHSNKDGLDYTACYTYTIRTEGKWQIIPKSENTSWVRFLSIEGENSSNIYFGVWPNDTFFEREADFAIAINGVEQPNILIHISQKRKKPTFNLAGGDIYTISGAGGTTKITATSNTGKISQRIEFADPADGEWLSFDAENSVDNELSFIATPNAGENERTAYVTLFSELIPEMTATVTVIQNSYAIILNEYFSVINFTSTPKLVDGTNAKAIENWTGGAAELGWTGMLQGSQTASQVYGRCGYILLGGNGRSGAVASPAFTTIEEGTADVNVSLDCVGYVADSGTRDYSDLYIGLWGPGTIEGADTDIAVNFKQLGGASTMRVKQLEITNFANVPTGIFPDGYDEWNSDNARIQFKVLGATSETRVVLMGGYWEGARTKNTYDSPDPVQNGITYRRNNKNNRIGIDNFKAVRIIK